jgi:hypothetical protein
MNDNQKRIVLYIVLALCFFSGGGVLGYFAGKSVKSLSESVSISESVNRQQQGVREGVKVISNEVIELGDRVTTSIRLLDDATTDTDELKQRISHSIDIVERNTSELEYLDIILRQLAEREGYVVRPAGKD